MKTHVIMKRVFQDGEISQHSGNGFFSATDLGRVGNIYRVKNGMPVFNMNSYFNNKSTKDLMDSIRQSENIEPKINAKAKNQHTWIHPYLFIDMALSMNPDLKITVYRWIFDKLIEYRNNSGDSYKKMAGALFLTAKNKSEFTDTLTNYARKIKSACGVTDWQTATESQLKLRDEIHECVSMLSDIIRDTGNLIDVAIEKAKIKIKR